MATAAPSTKDFDTVLEKLRTNFANYMRVELGESVSLYKSEEVAKMLTIVFTPPDSFLCGWLVRFHKAAHALLQLRLERKKPPDIIVRLRNDSELESIERWYGECDPGETLFGVYCISAADDVVLSKEHPYRDTYEHIFAVIRHAGMLYLLHRWSHRDSSNIVTPFVAKKCPALFYLLRRLLISFYGQTWCKGIEDLFRVLFDADMSFRSADPVKRTQIFAPVLQASVTTVNLAATMQYLNRMDEKVSEREKLICHLREIEALAARLQLTPDGNAAS